MLLAAAVFVLSPRLETTDVGTGTGNDTDALWAKAAASQTFRPQRDRVSAVTVRVAGVPPSDARIAFRLSSEGEDRPRRALEGRVRDVFQGDDSTLRFVFPALTGVRGTLLRFTLAAPGTDEAAAIALSYEPASELYPAGRRFVNEIPRPGDLAFTVLSRRGVAESWAHRALNGSAGQWAAGLVLGTLGVLLLLDIRDIRRGTHGHPRRRARMAICVSLALALLYAFPMFARLGFWAPDESDWPEIVSHHAAARLTLAAGEFPWWNPYICGGSPHFANPQTYFLSPTFLFSLAFGEVVGPKLALPLILAGGLLGMLFLLRTLDIGGLSAVAASSVFVFSGFTTTHLANGQFLWLTIAWVPWVVASYLRSTTGPWRWSLLGAAFMVLIFAEGRVYLVAYTALCVSALAMLLALQRRSARPLAILLLLGALTLFGSAWKLFPTLAFLSTMETALPNTDGVPVAGLPAALLRADVTPQVADTIGTVTIPRHEYAAYVGLLPLLLAAASLHRTTRRRALPFLLVGVLFLALATQTREAAILEYVPLARELRNPSRMLSIAVLCIGVLSGLGLQALEGAARPPGKRRWMRVMPLTLATLIVVSLVRVGWTHFVPLFQVAPHPHAFGSAEFAQTNQPETQAANGYPAVAAGMGAKDFCPTVLRAWRPHPQVRAREDADYRGDVYALGPARTQLRRWTPNSLEVAVDAPTTDTIVVNQQFDRGWSAVPFAVRNRDTLIAVEVPAGRSTIFLRYRPPFLALGSALTLATVAGLAAAWLLSRTRA